VANKSQTAEKSLLLSLETIGNALHHRHITTQVAIP